jgi:hypothetical protein
MKEKYQYFSDRVMRAAQFPFIRVKGSLRNDNLTKGASEINYGRQTIGNRNVSTEEYGKPIGLPWA